MLEKMKKLAEVEKKREPGEWEIVSNKCLNSHWTAAFLAKDGQECCECGMCKVNARHPETGYIYIVNESELKGVAPQQEKEPGEKWKVETEGIGNDVHSYLISDERTLSLYPDNIDELQSICDKLNAPQATPTKEEIEWQANHIYAHEVSGSWNPIKREAFIEGANFVLNFNRESK